MGDGKLKNSRELRGAVQSVPWDRRVVLNGQDRFISGVVVIQRHTQDTPGNEPHQSRYTCKKDIAGGSYRHAACSLVTVCSAGQDREDDLYVDFVLPRRDCSNAATTLPFEDAH